jgi:ribA/ribD-fused uncharacterized protein
MTIYFFRADEVPYGCFANFSAHGFDLDGHGWPTAEHYYQAQKFVGTPHADLIRNAPSPRRAADMGREPSAPRRSDWPQIKDDVMLRAVRAKFTANADILAVLLGSGDEDIVEDSPSDYYWGRGADGTGRNMLGRILMHVRAELRSAGQD